MHHKLMTPKVGIEQTYSESQRNGKNNELQSHVLEGVGRGKQCKEMLRMNPSLSVETRSNFHSFTIIYIFLLIT